MTCSGSCSISPCHSGLDPESISHKRQILNQVQDDREIRSGRWGASFRMTGGVRGARGVFGAMGVLIALSAKIDEKNRDVGRGDSGDAGGLGDGVWAVSFEFLSAFNG